MPIQQTHSDLNSAPQKLSKIETLRLARNYIVAMSKTLQEGKPMDMTRFINILSRELSQTTANLLSGTLQNMSSNYHYRAFYSNGFSGPIDENIQEFHNYKSQYKAIEDNYEQFWDYRKGNINYDNYNSYSNSKNYNNFNRYWECNSNVISNHYPYGNYQYVMWQ